MSISLFLNYSLVDSVYFHEYIKGILDALTCATVGCVNWFCSVINKSQPFWRYLFFLIVTTWDVKYFWARLGRRWNALWIKSKREIPKNFYKALPYDPAQLYAVYEPPKGENVYRVKTEKREPPPNNSNNVFVTSGASNGTKVSQ